MPCSETTSIFILSTKMATLPARSDPRAGRAQHDLHVIGPHKEGRCRIPFQVPTSAYRVTRRIPLLNTPIKRPRKSGASCMRRGTFLSQIDYSIGSAGVVGEPTGAADRRGA